MVQMSEVDRPLAASFLGLLVCLTIVNVLYDGFVFQLRLAMEVRVGTQRVLRPLATMNKEEVGRGLASGLSS